MIHQIENMKQPKVIISGGGSGGHIFPAIAIAKSLLEIDKNIDFLFVGASDKMEMEKIPAAGFKIIGLWISGFHRKNVLRNLLFPLKLSYSILKSFFAFSKLVVFSIIFFLIGLPVFIILCCGKNLCISSYATQILSTYFASNLLVIPAYEFCS